MIFERTRDRLVIRAIVTHPKIWPWIASDDAGRPQDFEPDAASIYLLVLDLDELLGLFILTPRNSVCWEVHTCLLPNAWGPRARVVYRRGIEWCRENTGCRKILGNIRTSNKLALRIAEGAGLKRIGLNTKCVLVGGQLVDQWIVGMEL